MEENSKIFSEIVQNYHIAEEFRKRNRFEEAKKILHQNIRYSFAPPANYTSLAKIYRAEGNLNEELNVLLQFKSLNQNNKQVITSFKELIEKRVPLLIRRIEGELNMSDNDVIYVWRAKNIIFNGLNVYKIGITSKRLGINRIKKVSKSSSFESEILLYKYAKNAKHLESKMLEFGQIPDYEKFDGKSEFRALNEIDLIKVLEIGFET